jgi:hypothetical protein
MERFFSRRELEMARTQTSNVTAKIFDNVVFLAEVFGEKAEQDIPKLPVLEMAQCFDLQVTGAVRRNRRRTKVWRLWK